MQTLKYIRPILGLLKLSIKKLPLVGIKRAYNYFLISVSAKLGLEKSLGKPILITIEPTNACDQKCPICETGNGELGRAKGFMDFKQFQYILDQFDSNLEHLFFYFMGEPFLNKQSYRMVKYATDKGIYVSTCTDGNFIDPEKLLDSNISEVNFQIGGMSQETHETYRVKGKLEKALTAMEELIKLKKERGYGPTIICGFILMKHNQHEVQEFIDYCKRVDVDSYNVIGTCLKKLEEWDIYVADDPKYAEYLLYDEEEYKKGRLVPSTRPNGYCGWIYSTTSIQVNGDVVSCCRDPKGNNVLGNVFNEHFNEIWNNKKYQRLRKSVKLHSNKMKLCELCPGEGVPELAIDKGERDLTPQIFHSTN